MKRSIPFNNRLTAGLDSVDAQDAAAAKLVRRTALFKREVDVAPLKTDRIADRHRAKPLRHQPALADAPSDRTHHQCTCAISLERTTTPPTWATEPRLLQQASNGHRKTKLAAFKSIIQDISVLEEGEFREQTAALLSTCQYIDLDFSLISEKKQETLLEELSNPGITDLKQVNLNLSDSAMPFYDVIEALKRMSHHNALLKIHLKLTGKRIDHDNTLAFAYALPKARVTHLNLSNNVFGNSGASVIFSALGHSEVTHLDLHGNNIDYMAAPSIAGQLARSKVTTLNLNRNRMGDPGAIAIARVLPESQLTTLSLCFNRITHEGAASFANALPRSRIMRLDLRGNNIGERGATDIASALPRCGITHLSLRENNIGDAGVIAIAQMLSQSAVTALDLRGNNISATGAAVIEDALAAIPAIRIIR